MINIIDKSKCCGCAACVQVCPKHCIQMQEDNEGFLYPLVDTQICIQCGLCEKICPELHPFEKREPLQVYAAKNNNEEVRLTSSSGGIFTLIAEQIIEEGGVVFGARFDEKWEVYHCMATTKEELIAFRGSKYVQSRIGNTFKEVKDSLAKGKKVLFSGTPCQVAGLKHYLRKDYENLITLDIVCHGVPSPKVWRSYISEISNNCQVSNVCFRDKVDSWKNYRVSIDFERIESFRRSEPYNTNLYMNAFLSNLVLRPSCYNCVAKMGKSSSDMTMGDFWGIDKIMSDIDDDKGCSVLLIFSTKMLPYLVNNVTLRNATFSDVLKGNLSMKFSVKEPMYRPYFFFILNLKNDFNKAYNAIYSKSLFNRIKRFLYKTITK